VAAVGEHGGKRDGGIGDTDGAEFFVQRVVLREAE